MANGGVDRDRTDDLKLAKLALSQLSYDPMSALSNQIISNQNAFLTADCRLLMAHSPLKRRMVGPGGVEPPTSRLSGVRSNHLSYEPRYTAVSVQQSATAIGNLIAQR